MSMLSMSSKHSADSVPPPPQEARDAASFHHVPVLLDAVLGHVPAGAKVVVDCTLGGGGHAAALLRVLPQAELFGCDRDAEALAAASANLAQAVPGAAQRTLLKQIPFSDVHHHVLAGTVDYLLADLGASSHHFDTAERGFSFSADGPLDMRMDPQSGQPSAAERIAGASEEQLREWFYRYGEERFAPRIAKAIVTARETTPITRTGQLAHLVAGAVPGKFKRPGFNPATRIFQALRIVVNDELGELETLLAHLPNLLAPGGRAAIIAFHSLEDRMVKEAFRSWESPCTCPPDFPVCTCGKQPLGHRVTRKPATADDEEQRRNPRSRSARLRVFEREG